MRKTREEVVQIETTSFIDQVTLSEIYQVCKLSGYACAVYRLPRSNERHIIIDVSGTEQLDNLQLDEMGSGFIFHPFSSKDHRINFIKKDIHIVEDLQSGDKDLLHSSLQAEDLQELFNLPTESSDKASVEKVSQVADVNGEEDQKGPFLKLVEKTIDEIQNGGFQKAVISRRRKITLPSGFESFQFFEALQEQYINAFIYLTHIPGIGEWLGATPETLINIDKNRQFQTIALAATQAYRDDVDVEDTTWSQKDIEEQAMVSRYIINCFKKIRLREFEEIGPRTYLSGNLVHLKTEYNVDMDQVAFPQLGTVMLELLHPTSAVCGMPKESSLEFILDNEGFDREYFSGFLGPVNVQEETNIFVNLRCMKLLNGSGYLFAGAGIIANSHPEKEWNETKIKMDTLLKVLEATS